MRIDKDCTAMLLSREISALEQQCGRCAREAGALSSFGLDALTGAAAQAAEERVHMRAALAHAHLAFCTSLLQADRKNLSMVEALPTTSPGVLDTDVAQQRIDEALYQRQTLEWRREEALAQAAWQQAQEAATATLWEAPSAPSEPALVTYPFDRLIACQDEVIANNERILEDAWRYENQSRSLYECVPTSLLDASTNSVESYAQGRGWGSTQWIERAVFAQELARAPGNLNGSKAGPLERFMAGELVAKNAVFSLGTNGAFTLANVEGTYDARGEALGFVVSLVPYGKSKQSVGKEEAASTVYGAELKGDVHVAQGKAGTSWGIFEAQGQSAWLVGVASGVFGVSVGGDAQAGLGVAAKAKAGGSLLANEARGTVGFDDYNYHAQAKGEAFTATAEAGVELGADGMEAQAGAEAYVATGELSSGFTLLGVKIDATLEAKAGGAGGNAGIDINKTSLEGSLGIGLGVGLGVKLKVDWSGLMPAWGRLRDAVATWWTIQEEGE